MKQGYFIYNGIQYNEGTRLIMTDRRSLNKTNSLATFNGFDTDTGKYHISICCRDEELSQEEFDKLYQGVWDGCYGLIKPTPESIPKHKLTIQQCPPQKKFTFQDELSIDGLLIAWIWYVFIMAVAVIFYDRIGIWILTSIVFFSYRNKKLKEAGYK